MANYYNFSLMFTEGDMKCGDKIDQTTPTYSFPWKVSSNAILPSTQGLT